MFRSLEQCWRTRGKQTYTAACCVPDKLGGFCYCQVLWVSKSWTKLWMLYFLRYTSQSLLMYCIPESLLMFFITHNHMLGFRCFCSRCAGKSSTSRKWKQDTFHPLGLVDLCYRSWRSNMPGHANWGPNGLGRSFCFLKDSCVYRIPPENGCLEDVIPFLRWSLFRWHVTFQGCTFWGFSSSHCSCDCQAKYL